MKTAENYTRVKGLEYSRRMLSHVAKQEKITISALRAACRHLDCDVRETKKTLVRDIWKDNHRRGGSLTLRVAEQRFEAALPVAKQVLQRLAIGAHRRKRAATSAPLTIKQRLDNAVRRLIGSPTAGSGYSGETSYFVEHGKPAAKTETWKGDRYSSRCTWRRTCAQHEYTATLSGLLRVKAAGLPINCPMDRAIIVDVELIRTEPEGRIFAATVITEKNKSISLRDVVVADQGDGQIYFGKTERGCLMALRQASDSYVPPQKKDNGRITQGKLAKRHGWCADGIKNWCRDHGISRDLNNRLKRGTTRKALRRLLVKQKFCAETSYDRTILEYIETT